MKSYEPMAGESIQRTSEAMIALATESNDVVEASFNKIRLLAGPPGAHSEPNVFSCAGDIQQFYHDESEKRHQAYISTPEYKQRQAEYEEKERQRKLILEGALSVAGPMEFKGEQGKADWETGLKNNTDPYGAAVYRYAEKWARLMQTRVSNGEKIAECANETSHVADDEGITGFMYGCAVNILSHTWIHGEELRHWHNLDTQIGNEGEKANESGGVLNPAMMTIQG